MTVAVGRSGDRPWARRLRWLLVVAAAIVLAALMLGDVYTIVVVTLVALATAIAIVLPLSWSVPLLLFAIPFRFYVVYPGTELDVALTNFIVVGLGCACLVRGLLYGRPRLSGWEWTIVAWVGWTVLSLAWTTGLIASLRGVFQWLMVFSGLLATAQALLTAVHPERVIRRILGALLALVVVWSIVGFVEVAAGLDRVLAFLGSPAAAVLYAPGMLVTKLAAMNFNWQSGSDVQPFGPFLNAIEFGIFTAVGIGAAVAMMLGRANLGPRWLVATALVLATAANITCLKATGWVAAGVAIAVAFITLGRSIARVLTASLATLLVLGGLLLAFQKEVVERLEALAIREGTTGATAEAISRPSIWLSYLDTVRERPFVGLGVATANIHGPIHWSRTPTGAVVAGQLPTENSYLTVLIETGLIGLVLLLATLGGAVVKGVRLSRRYPEDPVAQGAGVAAIGLAAAMAGNMTVDAFSGEILGVIMGILVGVVVAAARLVPLSQPRVA